MEMESDELAEATMLGEGDSNQSQETDVETKVIPLYVPEEAILNVFMVHGSEKSALALASFALGFQKQVRIIYIFCIVPVCKAFFRNAMTSTSTTSTSLTSTKTAFPKLHVLHPKLTMQLS